MQESVRLIELAGVLEEGNPWARFREKLGGARMPARSGGAEQSVQVRGLEVGSKEQSPSRVKVGRCLQRPLSEPEDLESTQLGESRVDGKTRPSTQKPATVTPQGP